MSDVSVSISLTRKEQGALYMRAMRLADQIAELKRELQLAKIDADRYNWLVRNCNIEFDQSERVQLVITEPATAGDWQADVAAHIDACISAEQAPA